MSGGFFRGTSADQDTRFSNKQAKLLKSQKFAPELDQLVDVTKVKMDVIKPWIANRVTELLGFEDEVLINFIFGLLDGKDVNGKEVQIQITGFMEKNTGRFMKELWSLLLSAQKNASGVPQQFLDAKEEEIRKKKVESDRITHEIQKRKEVEQAKSKSMDGELDVSKSVDDVSEPVLPNHLMLKAFDAHPKEDRNFGERNGSRDINRHPRTSVSAGQSPSSERINRRSLSKSFSNSRSYSDGRNKSRSISISPESHKQSISPARRYQSPLNRSISPNYKDSPRRSRSPVRRRRSSSDSWHRSPSPRRRSSLSPRRHKAPSPRRRRSPSPRRRRSPSPRRRRSPSPIRQRSPTLRRRRSPSPMRYRSPSPVRRRSPSPVRYRSSRFVHRRSPSPICRRSPSPVRRRLPIPSRRRSSTPSQRKSASPAQLSSPSSPRHRLPLLPRKRSPPRSPKNCRRSLLESPEKRKRSPSPYRSHSPPFRTRRSLSRERVIRSNGVGSRRLQVDYESERNYGKKSPTHHAIHREEYKGQDSMSQQTMSLMSPQRDTRNKGDVRQKKKPVLSPSPERSPSQSEHSLSQKTSPSAARRRPSLSRSPMRQNQDRRTHYEKATTVRQPKERYAGGSISESDGEEGSHHARGYGSQARRTDSPRRKILDSPYGSRRDIHKENKDHSEYSTERVVERQPVRALGHRPESTEAKKKEERKSEKTSTRTDHHRTPTERSARTLKEIEYGPGRVDGVRLAVEHATNEQRYMKQLERDSPLKRPSKSRVKEDHKADEKHIQSLKIQDSGLDDNYETNEYLRKPLKRVDQNNCAATLDSVSEENEKNKSENVEKRKHRRVEMHEMTSDEDASHDSHIDERKEAKRRRKEEKRLRKEERRRRREERRRRREEKRASKLKNRTIDTVTPPSDIEIIRKDADDSDSNAGRKESCPSDAEETESEQKKLEIELRKKALESLRAKKAINP